MPPTLLQTVAEAHTQKEQRAQTNAQGARALVAQNSGLDTVPPADTANRPPGKLNLHAMYLLAEVRVPCSFPTMHFKIVVNDSLLESTY